MMMAFNNLKQVTRVLSNVSGQVWARVSLYHASQHQCLRHLNYNGNKFYFRGICSNIKLDDPITKIANDLMANFTPVHATEAITNLHNRGYGNLEGLTHAVVTQLVEGEENRGEEGLTFLKGTVRNKIPIKPTTYNKLLHSLYRHKMNQQFFTLVELMKENGIEPDICASVEILIMAARIGDTALVEVYFEQVKDSARSNQLKQEAYATLIRTYFYEALNKSSDYSKVLHYYNEMIDMGYKPSKSLNKFAIRSILYSDDTDTESAHRVVDKWKLNNDFINDHIGYLKCEFAKLAIRNCLRSGDTEAAYQLVEESEVENKGSLKRFIQYELVREAIRDCVHSGDTEAANQLVEASEVEDKEYLKKFIENVKIYNYFQLR